MSQGYGQQPGSKLDAEEVAENPEGLEEEDEEHDRHGHIGDDDGQIGDPVERSPSPEPVPLQRLWQASCPGRWR